MADYKRIAERLNQECSGSSAPHIAALVAANLPSILSALELAAAVERLEAWLASRPSERRAYSLANGYGISVARTLTLYSEGEEIRFSQVASADDINAALDAANAQADSPGKGVGPAAPDTSSGGL